ncbi:esterase [Streptomyces sp. WAC 06738]|uniref:alpha/beta hydrolase n=1 Tax=Streptomyces sp. WAC 06738 TaxID=2203210 RepID=UPI000F70BBC8|nr:alpha/beta fold hydrolase [Streptomyces sp. WAC 06738]AZM45591.1 esterase [Streptomyces sp. WAC 06738]
MPVLSGAEPFRQPGGETGVLVCHGFTGSPQSVRPWAEHLAARGLTVSMPLLPGHGTRWQDLQVTRWQDWYATVDRELRELSGQCARVFLCGLSMGGTLMLRLAALHGDAVAGVVVVNPLNKLHGVLPKALPAARFLVRTSPGVINDIAKEGAAETGYDRVPLHAAHSLRQLLARVDGELPQVTQPLLVLHSRVDHVVSPVDSARILGRVSSRDVTETVLEDSYHIATLDHDAERIFSATDDFIDRLTPPADGSEQRKSEQRKGARARGGA